MKNIINITILIFSFLSCKAQQPIIPLYNGIEYGDTANAYYKDTFNDFNKFVGTWKYVNGNEVLKVSFRENNMGLYNEPGDIPFYEDDIYGDYQYINSSGSQLINSLSQIDNSTLDVVDHLIYGNFFVGPNYLPVCDNCQNRDRRVLLNFKDPGREYLNYRIIIRHVMSPFLDNNGNQIETIELQLTDRMSIIPLGASSESRIPYGKYTLIKQ